MSDEDQIKQLRQELEALYQQVKGQEEKILQLHRQLQSFTKKEAHSFFQPAGKNKGQQWQLENFIGLRLIHFIGIAVLVIGLSISVKYAIDRNLISEGLRVGLAYGAGGVLLALAWRLKKDYNLFSALLFSGAMASFYFTTYAAFVYYSMLPPVTTFVLMMAFTLFTVYQAIAYNRQEIAILGLVGAYAIPFLISANADRASLFFTYIAIINVAVVFLSYKKDWGLVSYLAQIITWILLIGWAVQQEGEGWHLTGGLFALFFFALFYSHALLAKIIRKESLTKRQRQDVLLNNLALFAVSFLIYAPKFSVAETAIVTLLFAVFTGLQAVHFTVVFKEEAFLKKALTLMALGYLLLFIGARWDGIVVTLLWLVVAVSLFSWGVAAKAVWLRLAGMILMGGTLLKLVLFDSLRFTAVQKIIAYLTLGVLLLLVGFFYQKFKEKLFGAETQ